MKKITYLVAPLMVLPFLVGCNKGGKTHNVYVSELSSEHLKFTDKNGKEINADNPAKATEGQDFVFNVEAKAEKPNADYEVHRDYIFALSGTDAIELDFKFEQTEKTSAKCTIAGKDITADIALAGMEYIDGYYLVDMPYLLGTSVLSFSSGTEKPVIYEEGSWYGYAPTDRSLYITFAPDVESGETSVPAADNIVLIKDLGDIEQPIDGECDWASYYSAGEYIGQLTIDPTVQDKEIKGSVFIAARGDRSTILNDLSWAEIKDISNNGYAPYLFNLGETKTVKVHDIDHTVRIIGFDHDENTDVPEGTDPIKYGITFQFETVISDKAGNAVTYDWNKATTDKSNHNFKESTLNVALQGEIFDALPPELKACIGEVTKQVGLYDKTYEAKGYQAKLFPLAYSEAAASKAEREVKGEGTTYEYFTYMNEKGYSYNSLRRAKDVNGKYVAHWERSPVNDPDYYTGRKAFAVATDGSVSSRGSLCYNHGSEFGIAPAFAI